MTLCLTFLHQRAALVSLLISYQLFLHVLPTTADTPTQPIKANCTRQTYTQNSLFATNLASLLSLLTAKSSSSNSGTTNVTESVYGLYMCQGDLPGSDCSACVGDAAATITTISCPGSRQGVIWYDNCELRYSDFNFFGTPDTAGFNMSNFNQKTTSAEPFKVVADLVSIAPVQNPLMFASRALADDGIYALAQCSVDLGADGCRKCLDTILAEIKSCCTGYQGWRYLATSCWVRYEATPFLRNVNATSTEVTLKNCSTSTFAPNQLAVMESNLNNLLSDLTAGARMSGYSNTTVGVGSNRLYGLGLCRGDLVPPNNDCNVCLANATRTMASDCPNSTAGIKWYEKCLMRYSDRNFFGQVDTNGEKVLCGVKPIGQAASDATFKLAASLVAAAANSRLMVAAQGEDVGSSSSSYVLVQCTRDLSSEGCKRCLERGLGAVTDCNQSNGWRYLSGSCTLRFEDFRFFNTSAISSPAPPPTTGFSPQGNGSDKRKKFSNAKIAAIVTPILGSFLLGSILFYLRWKLRRRNAYAQFSDLSPLPDTDLPLMDLVVIQAATSNFSDRNKLGEGGFGPVYKGVIHGGKEIAVKRLSKKSKQGSTEFRNEVKLIAKLQHKNLVKMLGCCIEREEKLLIYEFLSNKSLDAFLFDPNKRSLLDWDRRVQIIAGIARGLLYLHEDSRLKVIHRDLKASNVLLDNEMNPKISDFGMAKIYGPDESEANTNRIVGTYGYMAPEYAMDGLFSVKSDVYSFGVLLLEIISGEKNGRSHYERHGQTLLRHAWQLWNEDRAMELMDSLLAGSYPVNDAKKCIHIGLLCVQENPEERPTMSLVVHMLRGDESVIPPPAQPPTFARHRASASNSSSNTDSRIAHSINELTESIVEPR